jgi:CRP-like cAMP-binding protein
MKLINPFKRSYTDRELGFFQFLRGITLFEKLTFDQMSYFIPSMHLRVYKENEVVFFRGDPSHGLYLLKEGQITLSLDIKDRFENLGSLNENKSFGDNALVPEAKRIYNSIVSSEEAKIYMIPQINIFEVFDHHPKVKAKMLESYLKQQNDYMNRLFSAYKNNFGFFDLGHVYGKVVQ